MLHKNKIFTDGVSYVFTQDFLDECHHKAESGHVVRTDWTRKEIEYWLNKSDTFVIKSLIKLYSLQTCAEKVESRTISKNGVGFGLCDARRLSNIADCCIKNKQITVKQVNFVRRKIKKYANQLVDVANGKL